MASLFGGNAAGFGYGAAPGRDVEQLFDAEMPLSSGPAGGGGATATPPFPITNTLDEPIWDTMKRDLVRIGRNLVMVVFPFKDRSQQSAALRNWDLWGPMTFTLALAVLLSVGAAKPSSTFSLVFALLSIGAIALTVNAVLLGGTIGFFQSLCLLGYCLFPLDAAALLCLILGPAAPLAKWIVVPVAVGWASWASVPFIAGAVPPRRRALAVYPLCLLYTAVGWLTVVR